MNHVLELGTELPVVAGTGRAAWLREGVKKVTGLFIITSVYQCELVRWTYRKH